MKYLINLFTKHPKSVGETYIQHFCWAATNGIKLVGLSFAVLVHAIFPFMFETTMSRGIKKMLDSFDERK